MQLMYDTMLTTSDDQKLDKFELGCTANRQRERNSAVCKERES
jgi:hypothetical protein